MSEPASEKLASARNLLRIVRQETDTIGVAVSFGKDSLATLDLCRQLFARVEVYYLFRVREMEIVASWAADVRRRFGVAVRMYPHFDLSRLYRHAVLQPHWNGLDRAPRIKLPDIERAFRRDAQVDWIALGWRRNDSRSRAIIMKQCGGFDGKSRRVFPLRSWRRAEVLAYLASRNIPVPPSLGRKEQGGLDFHAAALAELKTLHPADWQRWLQDFPFADSRLTQIAPSDRDDTAPVAPASPATPAASTKAPRQTGRRPPMAAPHPAG